MKREIKFRAFYCGKMVHNIGFHPHICMKHRDYKADEDCAYTLSPDFDSVNIMQFTGLHDKRNKRDVYEYDIYFEEDAQDNGDRRIFFVITWINERCAFAMLEISEYETYATNGFDAIERDFDGFYFEVMQSSIDKMHYAGNIYEHPELLTPSIT